MNSLSDALLDAEQHTDLLVVFRQPDGQLCGIWTHRLVLNVSSPYWRHTLMTSGAHYNVVSCPVANLQVAMYALQYCYHRCFERIPTLYTTQVTEQLHAWGVMGFMDRTISNPTAYPSIPLSCRPTWRKPTSSKASTIPKKTPLSLRPQGVIPMRWSHRICRQQKKQRRSG
jgi:hypothetical protein